MIRLLVAVAGWLMFQAGSQAEPQRLISFERGQAVWVANLDGTGAKKVATGSAPSLLRTDPGSPSIRIRAT